MIKLSKYLLTANKYFFWINMISKKKIKFLNKLKNWWINN